MFSHGKYEKIDRIYFSNGSSGNISQLCGTLRKTKNSKHHGPLGQTVLLSLTRDPQAAYMIINFIT